MTEYKPLALRTSKAMPTAADELDHALIGLMTEIGEFASEVKRVVVYDKPLSEEMRLHCCEELGDCNWYIPLLMRAMQIEELPPITDYEIESIVLFMPSLKTVTFGIGMMTGALIAASREETTPPAAYGTCAALIVYLIERGAVLLGTTGDQLRAENIEKLRKRFPDAYSNEAAEARADKDGADHRNS